MKRKREIPSGFTIRKRFLSILMVLVMTLGYMPAMAWAAPDDPDEVTEEADDAAGPKHSKVVTPNGDGTYTIGLDVTGEADTTSTSTTANILVIFDTSNSMTWRAAHPTGQYGTNGNGSTTFQLYKVNGDSVTDAEEYTGTVYQRSGWPGNYSYTEYTGTRLQTNTRAQVAEKVIYEFAEGLYEYDGVEMALVSFNANASRTQDWTSDKTEFLSNLSNTGTSTELSYNSGTNWQAALREGGEVLDELNKEEPVDTDSNFVIFVTDGAPSKYLDENGAVTPAGNNYGSAEDCYGPAKDDALAIQSFKPEGSTESNTELFGIYTYGVEADYLDDVVYYALNGKDRDTETEDTDTEGVEENYFNASDTVELQNAVSTIFKKIADTLGIGQAVISDGTTSNVETTSGTIAELLDVDESSYKYWLLIPINEDGTFTRVNPFTGDEITYTAVESEGKVTISWKEGDENKTAAVNGSVSSDELKYQWEEKNDFYNFDPPAASLTDGTVKWDLSPVKTLLDGVTYRVTFDVWPSQTTLDYIADIDNDESFYDTLDPVIQKYLDRDGNLKTNTGASLSYVDTRLENPGPYEKEYIDPDPVETGAAEIMTVSKKWENKLDEEQAEPVSLSVNCDGEKKYEASLNKDNNWEDTVSISFGIMSVADNHVILRTTGHDFNFSEPESINVLWEIKAPTVHPMLINNKKVMLVQVADEDELAKIKDVDETKTDGTYYKIGGNFYKEDEAASSLTAVNERKSQLDLTKVVDDVKAPKDALFTYDVKIDDADQNDIQFVLLDEDEAPVENTEETTYISGSSLKADEKNAGYYSVPSGTELTIKMQAGWKVSFLNLATETTYDITESEMGKGFVFHSVDGQRTYKDADDKEVTETAGGTGTDDGNYSGTIDYTNSVYTVTYKNDYELTNFDVKKVWEDADDQDGIRPESVTVRLLADGEETGETATMSSDTEWACRFEELEKFKADREEIVYTVEEVETDVITGTDGPGTYAYEVKGDVENGFTVTNTHTPETTEVTVIKVWNDNDDKEGIRPDKIILRLMAEGFETEFANKEITEKEEWSWEITGLDKFKDGEPILYYFVEDAIEQYTASYSDDGKNHFTVTNSHQTKPVKDVFAEGDTTTSIDGQIVNPGDKLTYTITYTNTTGKEADVVITDKIPDYTTFVSADNGGTEADGTVTWTLPEVKNGESKTVSMVVEVDKDAEGQTLKNTSKVRVGENEYETNEVTNSIPTDPVKAVYFESDPETVIDGEYVDASDVLLYKVTYTNTTGEDVEATITDAIPEYTAYVDGSADHGGVYADGTLTWNVSVAKDASVTVSFKVQVNEDVDGDTVINKAVVRVGENDYETNKVINPTTEKILDTDNHFGYIIGYPVDYETGEKTDDKNRWPVRPTADITRAEVSTVFFRMLLDEKRKEYWTKENDFSDVSKSNWYNNAISVMAAMGILKGYNDGSFQPNKAITRAEMAAIAARFARMTGVDVTTSNTFTDIEKHWAKQEIEFAAAVGWINGYPDGSFHPQDNITRAEFMTLANRMLERQPESESDLLKEDMIAWPDNLPSDWWYLAVQEATNSHKYIRKGVTVPNLTFEYETWVEMLEMRDWSALEQEWSDADSAPNPGDNVSGGGE